MYMVERIIFEHNKVEGKQISFDISIFFFQFFNLGIQFLFGYRLKISSSKSRSR